MASISMLILLYNKEINQCQSINSLLKSEVDISNIKVVIWNNGPKKISRDFGVLKDRAGSIHFEETIDNKSISHIYNKFMDEYEADYYMIFDDDSVISDDYLLDVVNNLDDNVLVPKITMNNKVVSPKIDNGKGMGKRENKMNGYVAIGSGLVVSNYIKNLVINEFGDCFDSRFFFYGVDVTFFYRLKIMNLYSRISIISGFEHSISSFKIESDQIKIFRRLEASYSLGLKLRYYPSYNLWVSFLRMCLFRLFRLSNRVSFRCVIKSFFSGKHYRVIS